MSSTTVQHWSGPPLVERLLRRQCLQASTGAGPANADATCFASPNLRRCSRQRPLRSVVDALQGGVVDAAGKTQTAARQRLALLLLLLCLRHLGTPQGGRRQINSNPPQGSSAKLPKPVLHAITHAHCRRYGDAACAPRAEVIQVWRHPLHVFGPAHALEKKQKATEEGTCNSQARVAHLFPVGWQRRNDGGLAGGLRRR